MPRNELTRKVYEIMEREMQDIGPFIVRKQCLQIHVDPENIEPANLAQLAANLSEVMVLFGGHEKARKIYSELRKLKDLDLLVKEETSEGTKLKMTEELGKGSLFAGDWPKAKEYFEQLLADANARKDQLAKTRYMKWLGTVHQEQGEFDQALQRFEAALAIAKGLSNKAELANCYNSIGDVRWYKGDHAKAIDAYRLAASDAESAGFLIGVGIAHVGIGNVLADRHELDESIKSYLTALERLKYTEEFQQIARAYNNLGDTYRQKKNWDDALKCFGKSEEYGDKGGWLNMVAWARFNSAMVLVDKGSLPEAEGLLRKSEASLVQIGDRTGLAGAKHVWGKLYAAKGDAAQMDRAYTEAIERYRVLKTPFSEAECHNELGMAHKKLGNRTKALDHLRMAAVIYTDLKLDKWAKVAVKEIESMG
ncbi:MAG: tetratricopeptide repeat protein [Methanobacteriota archaeon]